MLTPAAFNVLASEYTDATCAEPTGNVVIVSGDVYGGSGTCSRSSAGYYSHSQCTTNGTAIGQAFAPDDDTCSGDVWFEVYSNVDTNDRLCDTREVDGMFYRSVYSHGSARMKQLLLKYIRNALTSQC